MYYKFKINLFTFKVDDVTVDLEKIEKQDETVLNDLESENTSYYYYKK